MQPNTCDCIQFGPRQIQGYPLSHKKSQEEEGPSTCSSNNPTREPQPKAAPTATAQQIREDTPWLSNMPACTNSFIARASWPVSPSTDEIPTSPSIKTEKAEDRTPPKLAAIPHTMPSQSKAEEMCRWGLQCPICAKSTEIPMQRVQKIGMAKDRTSCKETIVEVQILKVQDMIYG